MTSAQLLVLLTGVLAFSLTALPATAAATDQITSLIGPYSSLPSKELYRFSSGDTEASHREEVGLLLYPGTPQEELVVVGRYGWRDYNSVQATVNYTADKHGYRSHTTIKMVPQIFQLSPNLLKSTSG